MTSLDDLCERLEFGGGAGGGDVRSVGPSAIMLSFFGGKTSVGRERKICAGQINYVNRKTDVAAS